LNTIIRRSKGLLRFIDDYRNLTRVPVPNFQIVHLSSLFEKINKLFSEQLKEKNIQFTYTTEPANLEVTADPDLIDQVIINLILNSVHAVANVTEPKISLSGTIDNYGKAVVQVTDNGNGVPEELYEKIFIPFFTTRKEGSGIGLSLSRQIMRLHKGGITVKSTPGVETVFTLRF
ncbi:MAG: ATP-binding protein, partial [Ignavibacteriaceae bacterium]|nr:ATP-binding protein [Ignavibacteriaceae bacterium]